MAERRPLLTVLIDAAKPDFDRRSYGHKKPSQMVLALNGLETKTYGNHLMIRPKS